MWVKRTEQELEEIKARNEVWAKGLWISVAIFTGFALYQSVVFIRGSMNQFPFAVLGGVLAIGICLRAIKNVKRSRFMICPNCETTKLEDNQMKCSCGGNFEYTDTMKWV